MAKVPCPVTASQFMEKAESVRITIGTQEKLERPAGSERR